MNLSRYFRLLIAVLALLGWASTAHALKNPARAPTAAQCEADAITYQYVPGESAGDFVTRVRAKKLQPLAPGEWPMTTWQLYSLLDMLIHRSTVCTGKIIQIIGAWNRNYTSNVGRTETVGATALMREAHDQYTYESTGLPVSFSTAPSNVCTNIGGSVKFVGVGLCTITATAPGNATYDPALGSVCQKTPVF